MSYGLEAVGTTLTIGTAVLRLTGVSGIGISGFEKLDITTLSNVAWRTAIPQTLKDCPDLTFTCNFAPAEWAGIVAEINKNQSIVLSFPGALGDITFWGFLNNFNVSEGQVGSVWQATGSVAVSNWSGSAETAAVYA